MYDVASCISVETDRRLEKLTAEIIRHALILGAVRTSETSVNVYETPRRNVPAPNDKIIAV